MDVPDEDYYQQTVRLDYFYQIVKEQILKYQSPTIGLFPVETESKRDVASVRDSVYCAVCVWGLALAYRKIDDDHGRTYELEQSAVKCMRGILYCYMRQTNKVEKFKTNQNEESALHTTYDVTSGDMLSDNQHHLQIDAVSLYLLYLVQIISSGIQIIYTLDEVSFIQNLVYYVERAYRTPDFGMWGRGSKYNTGKCEVNASSIGMAKAALEATNGFNLFGREGTSWSVLYVDPDAHGRNGTILESLLPRESSSKNTDASLIPTAGFPAFALDTCYKLKNITFEKVIRKLKGKYGFRRFLRDGYGTVREDKNRSYYKPAELKSFDSIECEWPMFFAYMIIDGIFKQDDEQVEEYHKLLRPLLIEGPTGLYQIPKYYYLTRNNIDAECKHPHSQIRVPSQQGQGSNLFLWGQSIYIIACMLMDKLLDVNELDSLGRYLDYSSRSRLRQINTRYSAFESTPKDMTVQMVFIAESTRLKTTLATYGIQSQTPTQVEPIQIWKPSELIKAYKYIGHNKKLNLTGRPSRPFGSISTSKIYRIMGRTVLCYPLQFDLSDFYMYQDMSLLVDDIKGLITFVKKSWKMSGRPTFCILIKEEHFSGSMASEMLDMLAMFKMGDCNGIRIRVDRLQTLIASSFVEHLDFQVPDGCVAQLLFSPITELNVDILPVRTRVLSGPGISEPGKWTQQHIKDLGNKPSWEIIDHICRHPDLNWQSQVLALLLNREGFNFLTNNGTVEERLEKVYAKAGMKKDWATVRYCASVMRKEVDSLAPAVTTLLVRGKIVTIGLFGQEEKIITRPTTPAEITSIIYGTCQLLDVREAVMQQEMLIDLAKLIPVQPRLFDGMLKIRVGWLLHAMKSELKLSWKRNQPIYCLSPHELSELLKHVLATKMAALKDRTWLQRRQFDGALNRTPAKFYDKVWDILLRTPEGIQIADSYLPQQPTLSDMTQTDLNFALRIEQMFSRIAHPEYRQLMVELLTVISVILGRNPELEFRNMVHMDIFIKEAYNHFREYQEAKQLPSDMDSAFYNIPPAGPRGTTSYFAKVVTTHLLDESQAPDDTQPCQVS